MNTNQGDGVPVRGRGTWLARWASDLRLGVRLAVGGGRTSKTGVARLVLSTVGVGLAVGVLLLAASVGPMFQAATDRTNARNMVSEPRPGVDRLYAQRTGTTFRDDYIDGWRLWVTGPRPPLPPGVSRLPGAGEIVLSPALADLLGGPDGALLRPRFPQRVIGLIGPAGLTDRSTLSFYVGGDSTVPRDTQQVWGFGPDDGYGEELPQNLVALIAVGTVILLVPVLVFIAASTRIAGAERDRRLAALRLVGADARQTRRIAAAESLVAAATGLGLGMALFLTIRAFAGRIELFGRSAYPSDVTPSWPLVLLIVLLVPGMAVLTAQATLRRTIIEPLGVVRRGRPVRRRLWWRLVPVLAGPALLISQIVERDHDSRWWVKVIGGTALLLIGVPAVLPWLLERAVGRLRGGRPAMQLAIRRLQADSGTPARVVGGIAVVLAGAIALAALLASQTAKYGGPVRNSSAGLPIQIYLPSGEPDAVAAAARSVPGVRTVVTIRMLTVRPVGGSGESGIAEVDCAGLLRYIHLDRCVDGDVFRTGVEDQLSPGQVVTMVDYEGYEVVSGGRWAVPTDVRELNFPNELGHVYGSLVVTPGALRGIQVPMSSAELFVRTEPGDPDVIEWVRNAVASLGSRPDVFVSDGHVGSVAATMFRTIRTALLGGALFTLVLAGMSMLVLALEQMRERRRPLAALAASGVPTRTLARSLLWQNAVPVLLAVLLAVAVGIALAGLVLPLFDEPFTMDWLLVALLSGVAALLVLLVTALTLPTLRSATRVAALRSE
ncbi:MAG: FtsX-like permease family protein [Labedaea sp.]